MQEVTEHRCLPRPASQCPQCGETLSAPVFCQTCGENITPQHECTPRPMEHVCASAPQINRCMACNEKLPAEEYCATCGEQLIISHYCPAAPETHVHKPDPVHICPALKLSRCQHCNELLPALTYCKQCGMDITSQHHCTAVQHHDHTCPPVITMPKRCSHCGELKPPPQHCQQCGTNITPEHTC